MAVKYKNRNLLPLLAITGILLSVGLVNFSQVSDSKVVNTQSVLSKSDEVRTEAKIEDKDEDEDKDEVEVKDEVQGEVESEFEQETETSVNGENESESKFKLKVETKMVKGKPVVETNSGQKEVKNSPEDVANSLVEDKIIETPVSFEAKTNDKNEVQYEIQATEEKKFLGIFRVVLPKMLTISSETGEVVSTNQNAWTRFLSMLSI